LLALYLVTYKVYFTKDHSEEDHSFVTLPCDGTFQESCENWRNLSKTIKDKFTFSPPAKKVVLTRVQLVRREKDNVDFAGVDYELEI
jgi:hypothetical protein